MTEPTEAEKNTVDALYDELAYFLGPDQWEKTEKVIWKIIQRLSDEKDAEIERLEGEKTKAAQALWPSEICDLDSAIKLTFGWGSEKLKEVERLKQQLADAERTIRQCLMATMEPVEGSAKELCDAVFNTPLEDAARYVNDKFAEMECKLARAETVEGGD